MSAGSRLASLFPMPRLVLTLCVFGVLVALGSVPAPSGAQSDSDVMVDPNSPAGTEYDIPIRRARRDAQGGSSSGSPDSPALFGEGVEPDGKPSGSGEAGDDQTADPSGRGDEGATAAVGDPGDPGSPPQLARETEPDAAGGGLLLAVLGITLSLIVAAALGGWILRRRTS